MNNQNNQKIEKDIEHIRFLLEETQKSLKQAYEYKDLYDQSGFFKRFSMPKPKASNPIWLLRMNEQVSYLRDRLDTYQMILKAVKECQGDFLHINQDPTPKGEPNEQ